MSPSSKARRAIIRDQRFYLVIATYEIPPGADVLVLDGPLVEAIGWFSKSMTHVREQRRELHWLELTRDASGEKADLARAKCAALLPSLRVSTMDSRLLKRARIR